jgi:hypothetical protein
MHEFFYFHLHYMVPNVQVHPCQYLEGKPFTLLAPFVGQDCARLCAGTVRLGV